MAMWDDILNGLGIENGAAKVNQTVDQVAGSERGPNGSFDLNRIRPVLPEGMDDEANMIARLTDARIAAMREQMKPPTRTGLQFLGDALSAASVPVAYAQGNNAYGTKMAGNTTADQFNDRRRRAEDDLSNSIAGITDGAYGALGTSAVSYLKERREQKAEARKQLSAMLSAAMDENGNLDPASVKQAKMWAGANGFQDIWNEVQALLPSAGEMPASEPSVSAEPAFKPDVAPPAPSAPPAPVAPPAPASAPAGAPATGGPGLGNLAGLGGKLPQAPAPAAAPAAAPVSETPPAPSAATQALLRRANVLAITNPEAGEMARKQAEASYKAELDVWKTKLDDQAGRGKYGTSNSVWFENIKDPKQRRVGQLATGGGARIAPFLDAAGNPMPEQLNPADWRQIDPAELAGSKASLGAQGRLQGEAAAAIPQIESKYNTVMDIVGKMIDHPGIANLTGKTMGGLAWADQLPNFYEETGDAQALVDALSSQAFVLAFESIKGAGAITEQEGQAAERSLSRLKSMRVSDKAYKEAVIDFVRTVERLRRQAYQKAQAGYVLPGQQMSMPDPNAGPPATGAVSFEGLSDDELLKRRPGGAR